MDNKYKIALAVTLAAAGLQAVDAAGTHGITYSGVVSSVQTVHSHAGGIASASGIGGFGASSSTTAGSGHHGAGGSTSTAINASALGAAVTTGHGTASSTTSALITTIQQTSGATP